MVGNFPNNAAVARLVTMAAQFPSCSRPEESDEESDAIRPPRAPESGLVAREQARCLGDRPDQDDVATAFVTSQDGRISAHKPLELGIFARSEV